MTTPHFHEKDGRRFVLEVRSIVTETWSVANVPPEGDPVTNVLLADADAITLMERGRVVCVTDPDIGITEFRFGLAPKEVPQPASGDALPRHKFWGAGEADCPEDLKAANGELIDTRCKVCGDDWKTKSEDVCFGAQSARKPTAWMHTVKQRGGDGSTDHALSFLPDNFPLQGDEHGMFYSIGTPVPLFTDPSLAASGAPQEAPGDAPSDKLDAARYRWLRDQLPEQWVLFFVESEATSGQPMCRHDPGSRRVSAALDAAVDAAMKGPQ